MEYAAARGQLPLQVGAGLIINRAMMPESWSTVHDPMPNGDRRGHFGVG